MERGCALVLWSKTTQAYLRNETKRNETGNKFWSCLASKATRATVHAVGIERITSP